MPGSETPQTAGKSITKTLVFFDLYRQPLTFMEMCRFLLIDGPIKLPSHDEIFLELRKLVESGAVEEDHGFYCLRGRKDIIERRLANYPYYMQRVFKAAVLIKFIKYIPYIRSVMLSGSTAGMYGGEKSDIDFVVIVKRGRIWLARMLLTGFTQVLGVRRYGKYITDRICLSHYVAEGRSFQTPYRPLDYPSMLCLLNADAAQSFLGKQQWLAEHLVFLPEVQGSVITQKKSRVVQPVLEAIFDMLGAKYWDKLARYYQKSRIVEGPGIFISDEELSFHPSNKWEQIYLEFQQKFRGKEL